MKTGLRFLILPLLILSALTGKDRTVVRFGHDAEVDRYQTVKSVVALGGDVRIDGEVSEDAVSVGGNVYLGPDAVVKGNVVAVGGRVYPEPGAEIDGDLVEVGSFRWQPRYWSGSWHYWPFSLFMILPMLGFLAIGILISVLAPQTFQSLSLRVETDFGKSLLYGFIQMLLIVPALIFLVVTIVGIALVPIFLIAVCMAGFLGYFVAATAVGRKILVAFHRVESPLILQFILGILLLWAVGLVPGLGGLTKLVVFLVGFGSVGIAIVEYRQLKKAAPQAAESPTIQETPSDTAAQ